MTQSEIFRKLLDEQDIPYEYQDFKMRKITYFEVGLNVETFEAEFNEPLDGIPGTLGAMREFTLTACSNVTAKEAFDVLMAVAEIDEP